MNCDHNNECAMLRNCLEEARIHASAFKREWKHSLTMLIDNALETVESCVNHNGCHEYDIAPALSTAEGTIGFDI